MKKAPLTTAIVMTLGVAGPAAAISVDITSMDFGDINAATGTLTDSGTLGGKTSIDPFYGKHWTADAVAYFDAAGTALTWAGSAGSDGSWSFNFTLSAGQVAWGTLWEWNGNTNIAILNVMDCGAMNPGDACTGVAGYPAQNGPIVGQNPTFNGVVSAVPVPAAVWLMGSGLLGLMGLARRNQAR